MRRITYFLLLLTLTSCTGAEADSTSGSGALPGETTGGVYSTGEMPPPTSSTTYVDTETGPITGAEEWCSDGLREPAEECDDGPLYNDGSYGGCRPDCTRGPHCGDGILQLGHEACDDGNNEGGDGCPSDCGLVACEELGA